MIIRKLYKFENAHIVRNCSTQKCSFSLHGHSYKVEVFLESNFLDNGQMVYDFGLMKLSIKELIESFDHSISLWSGDDIEYINFAKKFSKRWIELPISPSAEQLSRVIFLLVELVIKNTIFINGEKEIKVRSVRVHETDSGYAEAFFDDANSKLMGEIALKEIVFSDEIKNSWSDKTLFDSLLINKKITNPKLV